MYCGNFGDFQTFIFRLPYVSVRMDLKPQLPFLRVSLENGNFCTLSALFNQAPGGVRQEQPPLVNRFLSLPGCVIVTLANDGTEAAAGENLLQ
ncbi:hypothetical protein DS509_22135 [Salmonella enterica subsp. diarizonae]|nr:hypothetical protein [Salmonella enterica subsp. diarizonae]